MASKFQNKNKKLSGLQVVSSDKIWQSNGKDSKGCPKYKIKKGIEVFGKIEKGYTGYITTHNKIGKNNKYVDDFSSLNANTKIDIVDMLHNKNKRVVYLVKK